MDEEDYIFPTEQTSDTKLNRNVKLIFLFVILQSFGRGIWAGNVLSTYIFYLAGESYSTLGLISSATGLTMTLVVFPAGHFADKFGRSNILKISAFFGINSLLILALGKTINSVIVSLIFWGLFLGFSRPSMEALFADSVPSRARSGIYAWRHFAQNVSMAAGPFTNVALFMIFGNEWQLPILKSVMYFGLAISGISILIIFLMNDKYSLGKDSEAVETPELINNNENHHLPINLPKKSMYVPFILLISNLIIGIGAGMTVKYFPLFFIKIYYLKPISVQLIMGTTSIFTGFSGPLAQKFSIRKGRAQLIFIVQTLAVICLFIIATYPPLVVLIPLFIARGSLMNASQPLSRSIIMDLIPKKYRGKWNSIEAIAWGLFWNISAAVGGFLIGPNDNFRLVFLVTASVYSIGTLLVLLIFPLVPSEIYQEKNKTIH